MLRSGVQSLRRSIVGHRNFNTSNDSKSSLKIQISSEVTSALKDGRPVVALESTIISHGMPYPRNLEVAKLVEDTVRESGAVPATIAVLDGIPCVGLEPHDLEKLARGGIKEGPERVEVRKASTRELGYVIAHGLNAATTVASTARLASMAGINVFATGGIGGVHRGGELSMDVSADLTELGRTPVTVVCAGIKSILDIPRSLEFLETTGVPVVGYKTDAFPAFFTNDSGVKVPARVDSTLAVAKMMAAHKDLGLNCGIVVAAQNPQAAEASVVNQAIEEALAECEAAGVTGAGVTPFLLARIERLTGGRSLESNIALVLNNARIASKIAVHAAAQKNGVSVNTDSAPISAPTSIPAPRSTPTTPTLVATEDIEGDSDVLVVGGAVMDVIGTIPTMTTIIGTSNPGRLRSSLGGVGRNVAAGVRRHGVSVALATAVANDGNGREIIGTMSAAGVNMAPSLILPVEDENGTTHSTAQYAAIHGDGGDLVVGVADMEIFSMLDATFIDSLQNKLANSRIVVTDGNISPAAFSSLAEKCFAADKPLVFEPTSEHKCLVPFAAGCVDRISIMKPNSGELISMVSYALTRGMITSGRALVSTTLAQLAGDRISGKPVDLESLTLLATAMYRLMASQTGPAPMPSLTSVPESQLITGKHLMVSLGEKGILWIAPGRLFDEKEKAELGEQFLQLTYMDPSSPSAVTSIAVVHLPAEKLPEAIVSTNGAGDAFCAGLVSRTVSTFHADLPALQSEAAASGGVLVPIYPNLAVMKGAMNDARAWLLRPQKH